MTKGKMKAVVNHGPEDYRLEERPIPEAGRAEVVVKVEACGVCGSDLKCYEGAPYFWGGEEPYVKPPVIPGHEFIGKVVELGEGAHEKYGVKEGDLAIAEQIIPCWKCKFCNQGQYWMCKVHNIFGFQGGVADGGFAEYVRYPAESIVHKVPEEISSEEGALIEPLACAIHAVERGGIQLGDFVVVAGMGPLGLCMLQVARLKNPERLIALEIKEQRIKMAEKLGADLVFNPGKEDAVKEMMRMTNGYGCDVYIEATGNPMGVVQGLKMVRRLGRFVEFSVHPGPVSVDWSIIGDGKELDIRGSHLGPYSYPTAIKLIHRAEVNVRELITHRFPLREYMKAFEAMHSEKAVKTLLIL